MDAPWIGLVLDEAVDPKTVYTEKPWRRSHFLESAQSKLIRTTDERVPGISP